MPCLNVAMGPRSHGDRELAALLTLRGVQNELLVYAGWSHADVAQNATVLGKVREWYIAHGLLP